MGTMTLIQPTWRRAACCALLLLFAFVPAQAQEIVLDEFESLDGWRAAPADGVALDLSLGEGRDGRALRLDFDFHGGGGYAIATKAFALPLPANYRFRFAVRAERPDGGPAPVNDLEFKLVDPSGENVWWHNRRRFAYPTDWQTLTSKKRHVAFAWGPVGGGEMERIGAVEFVVTAAKGGRGTVWIDDFTLEALPPDAPYTGTPTATGTAGDPAALFDADSTTGWQAPPGPQTLTVDFGEERELGGVALEWGEGGAASDYLVELSSDGQTWAKVFEAHGSRGGRYVVPTPDAEARYVRVTLQKSGGRGYVLRRFEVLALEATESANALFAEIAAHAPKGHYPRYFSDEQVYWTVVGADGDEHEALVGEDGRVEVGKGQFSIEPFLFADGRLLGWHEADSTTLSENIPLPLPIVERHHAGRRLRVRAFVIGKPGEATLVVRYRVRNPHRRSLQRDTLRLMLAIRPFQVNPPWQFLNTVGGVAPIRSIEIEGDGVTVVDDRRVLPLTPPDAAGVVPFAAGDVVEWLEDGQVPPMQSVEDPVGYASAVLAYDFTFGSSGGSEEVVLAVPRHEAAPPVPSFETRRDAEAWASDRWNEAANLWFNTVDQVRLVGPDEVQELEGAVRSTLGYIFVNRDGAAIQPGSRAYDRSWIRDGALTSAALLRLGHADAARDFAEWYAPFQYPSGKVPCCVDERGADPVPEHDSHGELIFLTAEVHRFTHDDAFLRRMWPHVEAAATFIDALRHERMTPDYDADTLLAYRGLLPESISHEGYSAKPMHSYWDQLFALKGLKDAVYVAEALGETAAAERFTTIRDTFARDLGASYRHAMQRRGIDYLPGSVELGDFDPTSVSIALDPVDAGEVLPDGALRATFERYWNFFERRRDTDEWEAYTPYEWRNVGALVRLGERERALEALRWFMSHRRPEAWNQWAEVVWRDPLAPRFIGDMPHTWVGSDFIRAVTDLFAYEESERLVVGAGLPEAWARSEAGVGVRGLQTHYGPLSYHVRARGSEAVFEIEDGLAVPPGGLVVRSPFDDVRSATVGGDAAEVAGDAVAVRALPARVVFRR